MRGSDWLSFRRSLAVARRLMKGAATPAELMDYVLEIEGPDAYPSSKSARERAFKRDRENLRARLRADFVYSPSTGRYTLTDPGELFTLDLSLQGRRALALLAQTFGGQVGEHSEILDFLTELAKYLPLETRRFLENPTVPIDLDLYQKIDPNGISKRVWETAWRATWGHRKLNFNYISPLYEDRQPRLHEVQPYRIEYRWGHWYLRAYRTLHRDANGQEDINKTHLRYRLSYIQDDDKLQVSPTVMAEPPRPPHYLVHYRLLPPLSRGTVSQHFDEMQVTTLDDGSLEITGYCDDEWQAGRTLLSYGEFCIVLGGEEVKAWMEKTVRGIKQNYPESN
jgi:predicted DNA-binding transcriptional regulator YafY